MTDAVYLDYNATTPVDPAVLDAMLPWLRGSFGNPSSSHRYGREARTAIDRAREQVASLIGCETDEILFTSGGTESNNLAVLGSARAAPGGRRHIVTSAVEHPAIARPCERLKEEGYELTRVPVDSEGRVNVDEAKTAIDHRTVLVTVMLANNETGTIMPIRELSEIAHARGALMHSDAAQAVGKLPVDISELGVDLLSIAGHKMYAPKGIGALYIRRDVELTPIVLGANHERGLRPGTENVPYIVGLGTACEIARGTLEQEAARERSLRDRLWELLSTRIPGLMLNGHTVDRLPNTLNISFPSVKGNRLLDVATEIAASTGSACHEGIDSPSSVLLAMGLDPKRAMGAVRVSLGRGTTAADIEQAATALIQAWKSEATPRQ